MGKPKHVGKWPCPTPGCGRAFAHKQSLQNHKSTCSQEKISCPTCKKTVYRKSYLKHHVCAAKPSLTCSVCDKSFKKKYFLDRHMITHTKEPTTYGCNKCGAKYKRKDHFDKHVSKCVPKTKQRKSNRTKKTTDMSNEFENEVDVDNSFLPTMTEMASETNDTNNENNILLTESQFQYQDAPSSPGDIHPQTESEYDFVLEPIATSSAETVGDIECATEPEPTVYILDDILDLPDIPEVPEIVSQETTSQDEETVLMFSPPRFMRKVC